MAILQAIPEYANLAIFNHAIFKSTEFKEYQQLVINQEDTNRPDEQALVELNPLLAEVISSQMQLVKDKIDAVNKKVHVANTHLVHNQKYMLKHIDNKFAALINTPLYFGSAHSNTSQSTSASSPSTSTSSNANATSTPAPGSSVPQYTLNRTLKTVHQVWEEYQHGIFGGPSVKELADTYGTKWRKDPTNSRYFLRRNILYEEMMKVSRAKGITLEDAAHDMDKLRKDLGRGDESLSLDGLSTMINKKNKSKET